MKNKIEHLLIEANDNKIHKEVFLCNFCDSQDWIIHSNFNIECSICGAYTNLYDIFE